MLFEKLRQVTQLQHQKLERKLVEKIRSVTSPADYTQLLTLFHGYFGGLGLLIDKQPIETYLPDYAERRKTSALAADLAFWGVEGVPRLATQDQLPSITNHLEALGALYVMEGSTLGGRIICQMIRSRLRLNEETKAGFSFFESYGSKTEEMWDLFKGAFQSDWLPKNEAYITHTASETFEKFAEAFDRHYP